MRIATPPNLEEGNIPEPHHQATLPAAASASPGCGANCVGRHMATNAAQVNSSLDRCITGA